MHYTPVVLALRSACSSPSVPPKDQIDVLPFLLWYCDDDHPTLHMILAGVVEFAIDVNANEGKALNESIKESYLNEWVQTITRKPHSDLTNGHGELVGRSQTLSQREALKEQEI